MGEVKSINERLKQIRKHLSLSQDEFGARIGLKGSSVSYIESGRNALTEQNIKAICREFNVDYLWLTTGEGEMFVDSGDIAQIIDRILSCENEFAKRVFTGLATFDEADWRDVERLIDKLLRASEAKKK